MFKEKIFKIIAPGVLGGILSIITVYLLLILYARHAYNSVPDKKTKIK